ncbi:MAG TPA: alpha/beta hydrolase [Candidatus Udaeobacter sp.]|nr:alpha/beta hydrolase [Candidatus Udaeobacter sp.]
MRQSHRTIANGPLAWRISLVGVVVTIIVVLAANAIWVDYRTRPAAPRDGGNIIDTGVEPANVKVEGHGPAILLLHGFGAAINWWDKIVPVLASQHRVIRVDLIGHGGTAAPVAGYAITRQAQLAASLLDKLGVDHVTVIGHSMGGEVAVALAEINPKRIDHMILIDSPPTADTTFTTTTRIYLMPIVGEMLSHFESDEAVRKGLAQGFAPHFLVPESFVTDVKQLTYHAFRRAHNESIAYRTAKPPYQRLASIALSFHLLVIFGSLDAIVPPEQAKLFEGVLGAKVATIEGVGHSPMVEAPVETAKLIEDFLK